MTTPEWVAPGEQGFLVGDSLYFRAIELGDAAFSAAWRFSPYPITRQRAEKMLKEELAKQDIGASNSYIACRRDDDVPVGAITVNEADRRTASLKIRVDPALGRPAAAVMAEMLRIVVPWLATERNSMVIWVELDGPEPEVVAALAAIGMRPAVRLREAIWRDGARVDQWVYEYLHPFWRDLLGDPGAGIEHATEPGDVAPAGRRVSVAHLAGPGPKNAILVSDRLALRLTEPEDAKLIAKLIRAETEPGWGRGRWLLSPLHIEHWIEEDTKDDPPGAIFLAVIRRESGELIGEVELTGIDWFNRTAETGSVIYHPALRGQGIGSEAKHLLLEYAFDHLGLHMLKSFVWSFNTRSQAALRKQGYRDAGRMQWRAQASTGFAPNYVFDLLASEWRNRVGPHVG
ncbi:MAG: GNAT family N-acetyltransferase [Chloroflexota bacterium]|nr:GNAT family N-acetyltransferase [Chloroflexota bacterium]